MKNKEDIIVEYKDMGVLEIYIDRVVKRLNRFGSITKE